MVQVNLLILNFSVDCHPFSHLPRVTMLIWVISPANRFYRTFTLYQLFVRCQIRELQVFHGEITKPHLAITRTLLFTPVIAPDRVVVCKPLLRPVNELTETLDSKDVPERQAFGSIAYMPAQSGGFGSAVGQDLAYTSLSLPDNMILHPGVGHDGFVKNAP